MMRFPVIAFCNKKIPPGFNTRREIIKGLLWLSMPKNLRTSLVNQSDMSGPSNKVKSHIIAKAIIASVSLNANGILGSEASSVLTGNPVSDTTINRRLTDWDYNKRKQFANTLKLYLRNQGKFNLSLPSGKSIKAYAVDGTSFKSQWASVICAITNTGAYPFDLEHFKGKGHELKASYKLLSQHLERDAYYLYDGLMAKRRFFRSCALRGAYGVVKTTANEGRNLKVGKKSLRTIKAAATKSKAKSLGVEHIEGVCAERMIKYKASVCNESWHGQGFTAMWLEVEYLQGKHEGNTETHFVLTNDTEIDPEDLVELVRKRWLIESTFRELNQRVKANANYIKNKRVKTNLLFWQLAGLSIHKLLVQKLPTLTKYKRSLSTRFGTAMLLIVLVCRRMRSPPSAVSSFSKEE